MTPILRSYGGRETYVLETSKRLAERNDVHILASEVDMDVPGASIVELRSVRFPAGPGTLGFYYLRGLNDALREIRPDVILSHEVFQHSFIGASRFAVAEDVPHVAVHHGGFRPQGLLQSALFGLHRRFVSMTFGRADLFVCVSPHLLLDVWYLFPSVPAKFLPTGADLSYLSKFLSYDGDYVVLPGRLLEWKIPVEIVREIASRHRTIVAGLDPLNRAELYERAGAEVRRNLERDEFYRLLAGAAVVAFPSTSEGSPITLIEAMALGKPIAATPVGAVPLVLGGAGLLDSDLPRAIDRLMKDDELRRELSRRARSRSKAFSWDSVVRELEGLLLVAREGDIPKRLYPKLKESEERGIDDVMVARSVKKFAISLELARDLGARVAGSISFYHALGVPYSSGGDVDLIVERSRLKETLARLAQMSEAYIPPYFIVKGFAVSLDAVPDGTLTGREDPILPPEFALLWYVVMFYLEHDILRAKLSRALKLLEDNDLSLREDLLREYYRRFFHHYSLEIAKYLPEMASILGIGRGKLLINQVLRPLLIARRAWKMGRLNFRTFLSHGLEALTFPLRATRGHPKKGMESRSYAGLGDSIEA